MISREKLHDAMSSLGEGKSDGHESGSDQPRPSAAQTPEVIDLTMDGDPNEPSVVVEELEPGRVQERRELQASKESVSDFENFPTELFFPFRDSGLTNNLGKTLLLFFFMVKKTYSLTFQQNFFHSFLDSGLTNNFGKRPFLSIFFLL